MPHTAALHKQRSLEGEQWRLCQQVCAELSWCVDLTGLQVDPALARSSSFMTRGDPAGRAAEPGLELPARRSIESTPQVG